MPAPFTQFVGGSFPARSPVWNSERTVNWLVEAADGGTPKTKDYLIGTPAIFPFVGAGTGPVRALFFQDGRAFAVSGSYFLEFYATHTAVARGIVTSDGRPATITSNGQAGSQIFVVSGGDGYIFNLDDNSFTQITDSSFPDFCVSGFFFDESFFALERATGAAFFSDLADGLTWSGIDFIGESQFSDTVIAMARNQDNIFLFGSKNTGAWYNAGGASTPYQPVPGSVFASGILAPFSFQTLDNTSFFLSKNDLGQGVVVRMNGYTPQRISTHPLETYLATAGTLENAVGWAYQEEGHLFYGLHIPSLPTTPVYDVATGLWCERMHWNTDLMQMTPWRPSCHVFAFGKHLWGDSQSGAIYESSLGIYEDRLAA